MDVLSPITGFWGHKKNSRLQSPVPYEEVGSIFPAILTEAPLDALSVIQACKGQVNAVATGGTDCARSLRWIIKLGEMPRVFVAFDADEAGDEAARWWLERLPNARRLRPACHDLNALLMQGYDLRT